MEDGQSIRPEKFPVYATRKWRGGPELHPNPAKQVYIAFCLLNEGSRPKYTDTVDIAKLAREKNRPCDYLFIALAVIFIICMVQHFLFGLM